MTKLYSPLNIFVILFILQNSTFAQDQLTLRELAAIIREQNIAADQRFIAQEKSMMAALAGVREAVTKAEFAAEKRFDSVNEFRATLKDQQMTLMSRNEADARFKAIEIKLATIESQQNIMAGKMEGVNWLWTWLVGAIGLVIGIFMFFRSKTPSAVKVTNTPDEKVPVTPIK